MEYFDFESAMRPDQSSANSANSRPALPSGYHPGSQTIFVNDSDYSWMSPETHTALSDPLGPSSWNNSSVQDPNPHFLNAQESSARQSGTPTVQDQPEYFMGSPQFPTSGIHDRSFLGGQESVNVNHPTHAAMTANNQEMQNWFAESARRDSRSRRSFPRRRSLYSRNSGVPVAIPRQQTDWSALDPLQRWQNSPPENEAASISAISHAVAATDLDQRRPRTSASSSRVSTPGVEILGYNFGQKRSSRPASISSLESVTSNGSFESGVSSRSCNSRRSASSNNRKNARSNTRVTKSRSRAGPSSDDRVFQCTFCCDTFKAKYDWTRHEKSLHLNPEQWICTPDGETITCPSTGRCLCAYCLDPEPSNEHLELHNFRACAHKTLESRSFKRKDHLLQHLRLVHKAETIPTIGEWKAPELPIKSRCGFCDVALGDWKARADHLSKHFREGKKMLDWRGPHGFEPHVSRQVTNAMPPWLIGSDSKTPIPFSATKPGHQELLAQITSRAALNGETPAVNTILAPHVGQIDNGNQQFKTAWELLTFHLGRFAQEKMKAGVVPTDEMFQQESRRLWFDSDDPWNQTFADDLQWMEIFRQEHGLHDDKETQTPV